jgi:hypothetical protein
MSKIEAIFTAIPRNGKPIFNNPYDLERYCIETDGRELVFEVRQASKLSEKERMYNYLFGPLMNCCVYALTQAGYEGMDKVKARYKMEAEFLKADMVGPGGIVEPYILDLSRISKERLLKFLQDIIFHLESKYDQDVPDSAEYKAMKGDGFKSIKYDKKE